MTGKTYDVAVVGASFAGCTAATLLAREGASVALIERHSDPDAYKVLCTHFIQPSAVPTMERLGLLPLIKEAGAVPNEIDMWTRWGCIRAPEGIPHGYNIRREILDPMLRRLAAGTPDVDFMPGQSARLLRGRPIPPHRAAHVLGGGQGRADREALPRLRLPPRRGA